MSTSHKEKIIRVLQLFQTTDEKTPMNAVQISQKLEEEYGMENVHRTSIYDDVRLLQSCGYPIKQAEIHIKDGIWRNICWKTGKLS